MKVLESNDDGDGDGDDNNKYLFNAGYTLKVVLLILR